MAFTTQYSLDADVIGEHSAMVQRGQSGGDGKGLAFPVGWGIKLAARQVREAFL